MKSIKVRLKEGAYAIEFGPFEKQVPAYLKKRKQKPSHVLIVTSQAVQKAGYPNKLARALKKKGLPSLVVTIPNGEAHKNFDTLMRLYRFALSNNLDRQSFVIAMGGGVTTDLAGFFAASYMRGIPYLSIPTTLLGMVDAAIGGKTGIDLKEGKNLVGAFWQPKLVCIDQNVLDTLPIREWRTGFAEITKYGVIQSASLFQWIEKKLRARPFVQLWPRGDVEKAIFECARIKAHVVSRDVKEKPLAGGREILNFGHTFGHALEAATVFGRLTHGEAISIGMAAAGCLALFKGVWSLDAQLQLLSILEVIGLPIHCPKLTQKEQDRFWAALKKDKKHVRGKLRFVVPVRIGRVRVESGIPIALVKKAMKSVGF